MSSMFYETLDAIENYYNADDAIQADCILWLKQIGLINIIVVPNVGRFFKHIIIDSRNLIKRGLFMRI